MDRLISTKILILFLASVSIGCSGVNFTPVQDNSSLSTDTYQNESFSLDGNSTESKVDVLFVVDNSNSMSTEQNKLGQRLSSFISKISRADWQIGIVTSNVGSLSDYQAGELVKFKGTSTKILTKNTANYANLFAVTVPRNDDYEGGDEMTLEALVSAIGKKDTANAGFFRSDASLAIVLLSDEDDRSDGTGAVAPEIVNATLLAAFGLEKKISAYGILLQPHDTACFAMQDTDPGGSGNYGNVLSSFVSLTGGITGSICDDDYGPTLESIGAMVTEQKQKVLALKTPPKDGTVRLTITPADSGLHWEVVNNEVRFNKPPKLGTVVAVSYIKK